MQNALKFFAIFLFCAAIALPVYANQTSVGFSESYFCKFKQLRKLFNLSCKNIKPDFSARDAKPKHSLQLRFFKPPITQQTTASSGNAANAVPTLATSVTPEKIPLQGKSIKTQQVDWVYEGKGRCWSAWADNSCSLISHEGGGDTSVRDLNHDGNADITCSQSAGTLHSTTITNISSKTFNLTCQRYSCTECVTGNGTHAQCDGGIDPSSDKLSDVYTIKPGCTATCTQNGAYGTCITGNVPTPTSQPAYPTNGQISSLPTHFPLSPTKNINNDPISVRALVVKVGNLYHEPWQILEAILHIEGEHIFNLSPLDVAYYQQPGAQVPTNCKPNSCAARGPAQFTAGIDNTGSTKCYACGLSRCPNTWEQYKNAVFDVVSDGRIPNVCNLKDSIYAAGKKIKKDSKTDYGDKDWTYYEVWRASQGYYGSCTPCNVAVKGTGAWYACKRLGMTYCDYVWRYYQEN